MALALIVCVPMHGLWRVARLPSPWPRLFLAAIASAGGIAVRVEGRPLARSVLFAANHLTWFDIPVLAGATGSRFVSKAEVKRWPLIGWLADMNRTVYVRRSERGRVAAQADALRVALTEGAPVALFPEGGTGDGVALGAFRAALFASLLPPAPDWRLQPVAIDYGADAGTVAWTSGLGFGGEMVRLLGLPGRRRATVRFLDPIDPATLPDRKRLAAAARDAVAAALGEPPAPAL